MDHHRRVDAVERAFARHHLLAAEAFLRRRAEIAHAAGQSPVQLRQRHRGAKARRRDDVVAAGMADAGQRVIFGEDRDGRAAVLAELGGIGGLEAERLALHGDAVASRRPW